jgi:hypothetical protein
MGSLLDLDDLTECHASARKELETLRSEAARYRFFRDTKRLYLGPVVGARRDNKGERHILASMGLGCVPHDIETLDDAVDAAMAKKR